MASVHFEILTVAPGFLGLAWCDGNVNCLRLPEKTVAAAERAVYRRQPSASRSQLPHQLSEAAIKIRDYFEGAAVDFSDVPIDLGQQDPFFADVYSHVRAIPYGQTSTYGTIARALGQGPEKARDVGAAMATNPVPLIVPCHRVLGAGGKLGGFSAPGGSTTKSAMLALEGVVPSDPETPRESQPSFLF